VSISNSIYLTPSKDLFFSLSNIGIPITLDKVFDSLLSRERFYFTRGALLLLIMFVTFSKNASFLGSRTESKTLQFIKLSYAVSLKYGFRFKKFTINSHNSLLFELRPLANTWLLPSKICVPNSLDVESFLLLDYSNSLTYEMACSLVRKLNASSLWTPNSFKMTFT